MSRLIEWAGQGLEGEAYTAVVRRAYDVVIEVGPAATTPGDWAAIRDADGSLALMPNAELTVPGVYAVRAAFDLT